MNLLFTPASPEDIPVIFSQAKQLIDTYEDRTCIDYDQVIAWVERKITSSIRAYTRVTLDGETCAFYRLCDDGELDDLYVLPDFQGRGIGSAIMQSVIAVSDKPLFLYVFSHNRRAIAFYERFGFSLRERVGTTRMILHRKG